MREGFKSIHLSSLRRLPPYVELVSIFATRLLQYPEETTVREVLPDQLPSLGLVHSTVNGR